MSELTLSKITAVHVTQVRTLLRTVIISVPEIDSLAVMTADGNMIASLLAAEVNADRYAAMCASLLVLAERASSEIERGELNQLLVAGSNGAMLLVRINESLVLAISCAPQAQLGRVLFEARKAATRVEEILH